MDDLNIDPNDDPNIEKRSIFDCVKNPQLKKDRQNAIDGGEYLSTFFFSRIFLLYTFKESFDFSVVTEHPVLPANDRTRYDLGVKHWAPTQIKSIHPSIAIPMDWITLLISEGKYGKASNAEIATAENQVYLKCVSYVSNDAHKNAVWALTYYGSYFRVWAYDKGSKCLIPFFPNNKSQGKGTYLDIQGNEEKFKIVTEYMKENKTPNIEEFDDIWNRL
ncbi:hypothetical protein GGI42DRAFT_220306 [Trichoderma sp. SZMC 28013]